MTTGTLEYEDRAKKGSEDRHCVYAISHPYAVWLLVSSELERDHHMDSTDSVLKWPSIMVCDGQPVFAAGLATLLQSGPRRYRVLAVTTSPSQLDALMQSERPEVVLLDAVFGAKAIRNICDTDRFTRVILLGSNESQLDLPEAFGAGARAYLLKHEDVSEICDVIRVVLRGYSVVPTALLGRCLRLGANLQALSETEGRILALLARGATNQEIARNLYLSERTVRRNLIRIYSKLCVPDRIQAALYAVRAGLVTVRAGSEQQRSETAGYTDEPDSD